MKDSIIKNKEWELAWKIANETDYSLFLTGKAGTGKTTFLRHLKEHTKKRMITLAPTGIAAINAKGVTIHSFFQMPLSPYIPGTHIQERQRYSFSKEKQRIIRSLDLIVIDEISMVRADTLDAVDDTMRRIRHSSKPFGGVQLIMIGDLQQLAPIAKEEDWSLLKGYYASTYFFDSRVLKQIDYATIELKRVFRQDNEEFINILNAIRNGLVGKEILNKLNTRYIPDFSPKPEDGYIRLTTHNAFAQKINDSQLEACHEKTFTFDAEIEGDFPEYSYPTDKRLTLKHGAQVMFIKNDTSGNHRYYNGMIGTVCDINGNGFSVKTKDNDNIIEVNLETWQNCKYAIDEKTNEITEKVEGRFCQFPVKLAWAITIHKSQGLTFSHAVIDASASFAHGQTYVALSRCKSLDGLVLSSPISERAIITDNAVNDFCDNAIRNAIDDSKLNAMRERYILNIISALFDFRQIELSANSFVRVIDEHLYKQYPQLLAEWKLTMKDYKTKVSDVAEGFRIQYTRLASTQITGCDISPTLQERIKKGANYFKNQLEQIKNLFSRSNITTNNKQIQKQGNNASELLTDALKSKLYMLTWAAMSEFCTEGYLECKATLLLGKELQKTKVKKSQKKRTLEVPDEVEDKELYDRLIKWRLEHAHKEGVPAYCILTNAAIRGITEYKPANTDAMMLIPGVGKQKVSKYGNEILEILRE